MNRLIVMYTILMVCNGNLFAQGSIVPLKLGDCVPDLKIEIKKGDQRMTSFLSRYEGKLLLLDFWGVYCTNCINSFEHLASLQNQFKDDLAIILVTSDSEEDVQKLKQKLKKNPAYKNQLEALEQLTIITGDSILKQRFPHEGQPTHVWIDSGQRFLKMTGGASTKAVTIVQLLKGKTVELADEQKMIGLDNAQPLTWLKNNRVLDSIKCYSFILRGPLGRIPQGIPLDYTPTSFTFLKDSASEIVNGISCVNNPIISLYKAAYKNAIPEFELIPLNRIVVEANDRSRFFLNTVGESTTWIATNIFSYALKIPCGQSANILNIMKKDLDRFFNLESGIEKREIKCIVMKCLNDSTISVLNRMKTEAIVAGSETQGVKLVFSEIKLETLMQYIRQNLQPEEKEMLVFNETGFGGKVNMSFGVKIDPASRSITILKEELMKYGLSLEYETREVDMLVIKDKR